MRCAVAGRIRHIWDAAGNVLGSPSRPQEQDAMFEILLEDDALLTYGYNNHADPWLEERYSDD